jgi:Acetyltransferase (GNAT) domain
VSSCVKEADSASCSAEADLMQLSIRETNPHLDPRWESFVAEHPAATVYHHPAWLSALQHEYRQKSVYLICETQSGKLLGIFPLMYTRGMPFRAGNPLAGARLASLPRTPLAGPISTDPVVRALLLKEAVKLTSQKPGLRLQIKAQGADLTGLVDGVAEKPWRSTYILQLPPYTGEPFRVAHGQTWATIRRSMNKAKANGMRVRPAETEVELAIWYCCYLETMRRNFVPARPYRFFSALWKFMRPKGLMQLLVAELVNGTNSEIIAGQMFFKFRETLTYAFGASRSSALIARPNDILLWTAIDEAYRDGIRTVDLGEVPEGDQGLIRFKSKWGAEPVKMHRYYYPDFADEEHISSDRDTSLKTLVKSAWSRLPLRVTSWLGDRVYARL